MKDPQPQSHSRNLRGETLVLLSGGIDSTACVAFYYWRKFSVRGVFVDYGQAAAPFERLSAKSVSEFYNIPLTQLSLGGCREKSAGLILGRNALLAFIALMESGMQVGLIAFGIHEGTNYYDCSSNFLQAIQGIFDAYTQGRVRVAAPFIEWTKQEIWEFSRSAKVPLHLTYSCELGMEQPCGQCLSCRDLEALRVS